MPLPNPFDSNYRIASNHEIRSWSFGRITRCRVASHAPLEEHLGTLADQRIFGPIADHRCACGQYDGMKYDGMICDLCGVKVTSTDVRKSRFGHIEIEDAPVQHPFDATIELQCFPVIPVAYLESRAGEDLCSLYEQVLANPASIVSLVEYLTPIATMALQWNTMDFDIFARGIGLFPHSTQ